jgi:hypothetical protein
MTNLTIFKIKFRIININAIIHSSPVINQVYLFKLDFLKIDKVSSLKISSFKYNYIH